MERWSRLSRSFRNDAQLKQYYLDGVVPTGKSLGTGSYGSVVEVKYQQLSCAAKRMHDLLLDPGNAGVQQTIEKYRRECQLMASLRHPNITQFLGLCFLEGSELPLLVMEKLEMSVDDLLECAPNIPLPVKISILTDTCSGLVYLHGMPSPIIHRDLTASNILLTSSLSAKITDMGNSRIVNVRPAQLAKTMSKYPGTLVYMPPEALSDSHRYGPSLDVFSFGHLSLYILTQVFPGDLLPPTLVDPHNPGEVVGRSEVKRREVYITKLESLYTEFYSILVELVTNSLHNNPEERPSAVQLLTRLQQVSSEVEKTYGGSLMSVTHVLHTKQIKQKDKTIDEMKALRVILETENIELTSANIKLEDSNKSLETEKRQMETSITQIQRDNSQLLRSMHDVQTENNLLKTEIAKLKSDINQLTLMKDQIADEKFQIESHYKKQKFQLESIHEQEKLTLRMEIEGLTRKLQGSTKMSLETKKTTFPLQLDWRCGADMPVAMSVYIQSVEINGIVYVGGGYADSNKNEYIVRSYDTKSCQWHSQPPYETRGFAMTTINSKLVLVGGVARDNSNSSELGEWQPDNSQWTRPFPPMPTPRRRPSATTYKHWLVVAGGYHGVCLQFIVEILDVTNMQWSTGRSTPTPWHSMKYITLGDTGYFMGGRCDDVGYGPDVYSVSLEALVSQKASDSSNLWQKLPSLNCSESCPLIFGGSLLAVGGRDMKSKKPVSIIQRYVPETNTWVLAGLLPHAVCFSTCIKISDTVHVIGGRDEKTKRLKNIFTSNFL